MKYTLLASALAFASTVIALPQHAPASYGSAGQGAQPQGSLPGQNVASPVSGEQPPNFASPHSNAPLPGQHGGSPLGTGQQPPSEQLPPNQPLGTTAQTPGQAVASPIGNLPSTGGLPQGQGTVPSQQGNLPGSGVPGANVGGNSNNGLPPGSTLGGLLPGSNGGVQVPGGGLGGNLPNNGNNFPGQQGGDFAPQPGQTSGGFGSGNLPGSGLPNGGIPSGPSGGLPNGAGGFPSGGLPNGGGLGGNGQVGGSFGTCVAQQEAEQWINRFISIVTHQSSDLGDARTTAEAIIGEQFVEISNSILSLQALPLDGEGIAAHSKSEWVEGVLQAPAFGGVQTLKVFVGDCNQVFWYWNFAQIGSGQYPVKGFNLFTLERGAQGQLQASQLELEFDSLAWALDTGFTCEARDGTELPAEAEGQ